MPVGWPISQFLSYPISFLFPGYKSFLAVMSEAGDDDTRWLCYWVLCGLLFFFEAALSVVPEHFPLYYELKCLVLLFLLGGILLWKVDEEEGVRATREYEAHTR